MTSNSTINDTSTEISTNAIDSYVPKVDHSRSSTAKLGQSLVSALMLCVSVLVILLSVYLLVSQSLVNPSSENTPQYRTNVESPQRSITSRSSSVLSKIMLWALKIVSWLLIFLFGLYALVIPLVFCFWTRLHYDVIFQHRFEADLNKDSRRHSKCLRNGLVTNEKYLDASGKPIRLGVWHIPPFEAFLSQPSTLQEQLLPMLHSFADDQLVVLYAHGAGGTRGHSGRNAFYKRLSNRMQVHVIAFDYRGFSDSSPALPNARRMARDIKMVYSWILSQGVEPERVIVWGHSLGAALTVRFLGTWRASTVPAPLCAILEAPLVNISQVIESSSISRYFKPLPWFKCCIVNPIANNRDININPLDYIAKAHCPVMILHAKDDQLVPVQQAVTLHEAASKHQPTSVRHKARIHIFGWEYSLGHGGIPQAPNLMAIVNPFIQSLVVVKSTIDTKSCSTHKLISNDD